MLMELVHFADYYNKAIKSRKLYMNEEIGDDNLYNIGAYTVRSALKSEIEASIIKNNYNTESVIRKKSVNQESVTRSWSGTRRTQSSNRKPSQEIIAHTSPAELVLQKSQGIQSSSSTGLSSKHMYNVFPVERRSIFIKPQLPIQSGIGDVSEINCAWTSVPVEKKSDLVQEKRIPFDHKRVHQLAVHRAKSANWKSPHILLDRKSKEDSVRESQSGCLSATDSALNEAIHRVLERREMKKMELHKHSQLRKQRVEERKQILLEVEKNRIHELVQKREEITARFANNRLSQTKVRPTTITQAPRSRNTSSNSRTELANRPVGFGSSTPRVSNNCNSSFSRRPSSSWSNQLITKRFGTNRTDLLLVKKVEQIFEQIGQNPLYCAKQNRWESTLTHNSGQTAKGKRPSTAHSTPVVTAMYERQFTPGLKKDREAISKINGAVKLQMENFKQCSLASHSNSPLLFCKCIRSRPISAGLRCISSLKHHKQKHFFTAKRFSAFKNKIKVGRFHVSKCSKPLSKNLIEEKRKIGIRSPAVRQTEQKNSLAIKTPDSHRSTAKQTPKTRSPSLKSEYTIQSIKCPQCRTKPLLRRRTKRVRSSPSASNSMNKNVTDFQSKSEATLAMLDEYSLSGFTNKGDRTDGSRSVVTVYKETVLPKKANVMQPRMAYYSDVDSISESETTDQSEILPLQKRFSFERRQREIGILTPVGTLMSQLIKADNKKIKSPLLNDLEPAQREARKRHLENIITRVRIAMESQTDRLVKAGSNVALQNKLDAQMKRSDEDKPYYLERYADCNSGRCSSVPKENFDPVINKEPSNIVAKTDHLNIAKIVDPVRPKSDAIQIQQRALSVFPTKRHSVVETLLASGRLDVYSRAAAILRNIAKRSSTIGISEPNKDADPGFMHTAQSTESENRQMMCE